MKLKLRNGKNPDIETVPTEDVGRFRPAEKTTEIVVSGNESGQTTKVKASTPNDLISGPVAISGDTTERSERTVIIEESGGEEKERKRKNVAPAGHTVQRTRIEELFTEDDVDGSVYPELTLKHSPLEILSLKGRDEQNKLKSGKLFPRWRPIYTASHRYAGTRFDVYELVEGQKISIQNDLYEYEEMSQKVADKRYNGIRYVYRVVYIYLENYDPNYSD